MFQFLNPMLFWGMALGLIPIVIHLLNRRRFRRVEWAPMRYLRMTIQRNRRRIQFEQVLLLLLRIALPLMLFLFLARPVLRPTGLEKWGLGGRSSQVVLVDDSLSMGYASSGPSAFARAREVAGSLLAKARAEDRWTLVAASAPKVPVFHEVEGSRLAEVSAEALNLPQSGVHAAWPGVLEGVDEVLRSCTYPARELTILTDLRKAGWDAAVGAVAKRWEDAGVKVRVVDVGEEATANLALESLNPLDRTILAGAETRWEAVIRNDSPRAVGRLKAILRVDDRPTEITLPEIPARQAAKVPVSARFPSAGMHDVSLELPDDELPGDNRRWAAVPVRDSLLIRLVDGEPSAEPFGSEVDYLAAPLSVGVGDAEAWRVEVVTEDDFLAPRLDPADVLVLANVAAPTVEQARKLPGLVRAGMGLAIFSGAKLDAGLYNERLLRGGDPLLPSALKSQVDETIRGVLVEPVRPSPIEKLMELKASALERVAVRQFMAVEEPAEGRGEVRVLARWNDPGRSPAILERTVGEGRVLLWTTSADRAGNDWPIEPSFVLAVREAIRGSARPTPTDHTVTAGDRPRRVVRSDQQVVNARVTPPGDSGPRALAAVPLDPKSTADQAPGASIDLGETRRPGLYRLAWDEGPLGTQADLYAANPDAREVPLERIAEPALKSLLAPLAVDVIAARGDGTEATSTAGLEIWRPLAWGMLALLIFEPILASWVGRSR